MVVVPGKLVLAGEYGVLVPGGKALVMAVGPGVPARADRRTPPSLSSDAVPAIQSTDNAADPTADADAESETLTALSPPILLKLPGLDAPISGWWKGNRLELEPNHPRARFAAAALEALARQAGAFSIELELEPAGWSTESGIEGRLKPGFGGSAASAVATLAASTKALGMRLTRADLHHLAHEAHLRAQRGQGSGVDVAASVFGGLLEVESVATAPPPARSRFMRAFPTDRFGPAARLEPPSLRSLTWPKSWELLTFWTGSSSPTAPRAATARAYMAAHPNWAEGWLAASNAIVEKAAHAIRKAQLREFVEAIQANRAHLLKLGEQLGLEMENDRLSSMCEVGARYGAAKQSGAGGGDSGFVIPLRSSDCERVIREMEGAGLVYIPLQRCAEGPRLA